MAPGTRSIYFRSHAEPSPRTEQRKQVGRPEYRSWRAISHTPTFQAGTIPHLKHYG